MTTRIHSDLRNLALAYYRGWIPRERYLSIRHDYLQSISNDETPAPIDPKEISPPKKKTVSSTPTSSHAARKHNSLWLLIVIPLGVLFSLIVFVYLFMGPSTQKPTPVINDNIQKPAAVKKSPLLTDEQRFNAFLTENFIGQGVWKQDALNSLKLKWLGLSQEQQKSVSMTKTFQDFSSALIERIVDERELNNIVPSDYELALMTAARNMGMINAIPNTQ